MTLNKSEDDLKEWENNLLEKEKELENLEDRLYKKEKEIEETEKDIERKEKNISFKAKILQKNKESLIDRENLINEEFNLLNEEKEKFTLEKYELQKKYENDIENIIEPIKKRNKELTENLSEFLTIREENTCLSRELELAKKNIETLANDIIIYKGQLSEYESNTELLKVFSIDERNKRNESLKNENKILKDENERLNIKITDLNSLEHENKILKDTNEIFRSKIARLEGYVEYLKRIDSIKDVGKDSTGMLFRKIINDEVEDMKNLSKVSYRGDEKFINEFIQFCSEAGFKYDEALVRAFISSIKSSKLTILKGYSGTGKSSLPELLAMCLNAECITIPIQPNWRTKQDIIGFYNYFTNKFIPTELTQTLIRANVSKDKIFFIVLDEMNLSRVEYYFSEFNSKIWLSEDKRYIELFEGNSLYDDEVSKYIVNNKIKIPNNVFFIGTINEDDSVSPISDKIFDRAQVVEFIQLPEIKKVGDLDLAKSKSRKDKFTKFDSFIDKSINECEFNRSMEIIDLVNKFMKENFDKVIGYRSIKQVKDFIRFYLGSGGSEIDALDYQLVSKFMPKIKFMYSESEMSKLEELHLLIEEEISKKFNISENKHQNINILKQIDLIIERNMI